MKTYSILFFPLLFIAVHSEVPNLRTKGDKPKFSVPKGNAFGTIERVIRYLSKNPNFELSSEFRDKNGNFLPAEFNSAEEDQGLLGSSNTTPTKATQCSQSSSGYSSGSATEGGVTLSYDYDYSIGVTNSVCVYMQADMAAINMNFDPNNKAAIKSPITFSSDSATVSGVDCKNCYAYIGADVALSMSCSVSITLSGDCSFAFSTGGGIAFNMELDFDDPSVSGEFVDTLFSAPAITLFSDPEILTTITATPTLEAGVGAQFSATGEMAFVGAFVTEAELGMSYDMDSNTFASGFSTPVTLDAPSITGTGFSMALPYGPLAFSITPTVEWVVSFGVENTFTLDFTFTTPFTATYTYSADSKNVCSSQESMTTQVTMDSISLAFPVLCSTCGSVQLCGSVSSGTIGIYTGPPGDTCLSTAVVNGSPTQTPTVTPTSTGGTGGGGGGGSSSNSAGTSSKGSNLSAGDISAAVILPILFVVGLVFGAYYYYYAYQAKSTPAADKGVELPDNKIDEATTAKNPMTEEAAAEITNKSSNPM